MSPPPLVRTAHVLHSPTLAGTREASIKLIDSRIAPAVASGAVRHERGHEPADVAADVSKTVDLDAAHVDDPVFKPLVRSISVRQLSNAMKHMDALKAIADAAPSAQEDGLRFSLVMEDDALFTDNVLDVLGFAARDAPADADVVFLGLPSPRSPPAGGGAVFDEAAKVFNPLLPACDSYLITASAARKLATAFLPVRFPTHVQLSYLIKHLQLRTYVSVPNVFVDGSKIGVFASSLDANNRLLWNQQYCQMEAMVRGPQPCTPEAFERVWAEQPFKTNPDNLALRAAYLARAGKYAEAETAYAETLKAYDANGCVVNQTSEFLRAYVDLFRHLQTV